MTEPESPARRVNVSTNATSSTIRDIWDKNRSAQRDASTETAEVLNEDEIDIPAFLREHRKGKD